LIFLWEEPKKWIKNYRWKNFPGDLRYEWGDYLLFCGLQLKNDL